MYIAIALYDAGLGSVGNYMCGWHVNLKEFINELTERFANFGDETMLLRRVEVHCLLYTEAGCVSSIVATASAALGTGVTGYDLVWAAYNCAEPSMAEEFAYKLLMNDPMALDALNDVLAKGG